MGKFEGRKILGVILVCFVLSAVYDTPVKANRNKRSTPMALSQAYYLSVIFTNTPDSHPHEGLSDSKNSTYSQAAESPIFLKNGLEAENVLQVKASHNSFLQSSSFPVELIIFGAICILVLFFLYERMAKLSLHPALLLFPLFLFAFSKNGQGQTMSQTFNSSGTFTVPAGVTSVTVECWGAGGGGAGDASSGGNGNGGGGGGAYEKINSFTVVPGNSYTLTVGTGGNGGAAGNNPGNNGGTSSFNGTTCVAVGGSGGQVNSNGGAGGAGGLAIRSTGNVQYNGGNAAAGGSYGGGGGGGSAGTASNGNSGSNATGGIAVLYGGAGGNGRADNTGLPGIAPGGGGGGAEYSRINQAGGNGAAGQVLITWAVPAGYCLGNAISVISQTGVTNYNNSLGAADNNGAQLYETNDQLTLELTSGDLLTAGGAVDVRWQRTSTNNTNSRVEISANRTAWTPVGDYAVNYQEDTWFTQSIPLSINARYIRFTRLNGSDLLLDAVSFYTPCAPPCTIPAQSSAISGSTTPCQGSSQTYSVTNDPGVTYSWIFPAGWTQTAGGTTHSVTVIVGSGSGNVQVTPSRACGNGPARTLAISVPPNFTSGTIQSTGQTICYNGDPSVIGSLSAASGGNNVITYKWQANGVDIAGSNSAIYDPPTGLTANTTYTRWAKDNTCSTTYTSSTGSWQVMIDPLLSKVDLTPNTDQAICLSGPGDLLTVSETGGGAITSRVWGKRSVPGGAITPIPGAAGSTYMLSGVGLTLGTWYVVCTSTPACGSAIVSNEVKVVVNPGSNANAGPAMEPICMGETSAPLGGSNEGPATWSSSDGGTFSNKHDLNATYTPPALFSGMAHLTLTSDEGNCSLSGSTKTIFVEQMHTVGIGLSMPDICQGGTSLPLGGSYEGGATSAIWSDGGAGGSFSNNDGETPAIATYTASSTSASPVTLTLTTNPGKCPSRSLSKTIVVSPRRVATFHYAGSAYCSNAADPTPIFTGGGVAGTFTSTPAGLVFLDTSTGLVDVSASIPGSYTVTNTIAASGACESVTANGSITITGQKSASFNYPGTPYCSDESNPLPEYTPGASAGVFSAIPAGLKFVNTATGEINLSTSAPGTYGVTNTIGAAGGCAGVYAFSYITITKRPDATFSYSGSPYCSNAPHQSPVFPGGASAGTFTSSPAGIEFVSQATGQIDISSSLPGTYTIVNTIPASGGCSAATATYTITILQRPTLTVEYCTATSPKIRLTATGGGTYRWLPPLSGNTASIDVDIVGIYGVEVINGSCVETVYSTVNNELVVNGDFSDGNKYFTSFYSNDQALNGLVSPASEYAIHNNAQDTHYNFWGYDHTSGTGTSNANFMIVNGANASLQPVVWQETITIQPNVNYYFSAWAMSLNNVSPYAELRFAITINGITTPIGSTAYLSAGQNILKNPWWPKDRFYGTWSSSTIAAGTSAVISILDLNTSGNGNDFGLDDISFGTLTPAPSTLIKGNNVQTVCVNKAIEIIKYSTEFASLASVEGLPPGVTYSMASNILTIIGIPTSPGTFIYKVTLKGCGPDIIKTGTITVNPNVSAGTISGTTPICIGTTGYTYTSDGASGGTWSSTNTAVATVNATTGVVTAIQAGTTEITYTINSGCGSPASAFKTLTVAPNASVASVTGLSPLCIGIPAQYTAYAVVLGAGSGAWSSSNDAIATVDVNGVVTAKGPGTCNIIYTITGGCGGMVTAQQSLTINSPSFSTPNNLEFCVSNIMSAIYDGQPEPDADIIPVGWKSGEYRRPDWYIVNPGSTELDITNLAGNCYDTNDLKWTIDFSDGHPDISGIGQPSEYDDPLVPGFPNPIKIWGTENYTDIQHRITYTVTDRNSLNNKTVHSEIITIKPRPQINKTFN